MGFDVHLPVDVLLIQALLEYLVKQVKHGLAVPGLDLLDLSNEKIEVGEEHQLDVGQHLSDTGGVCVVEVAGDVVSRGGFSLGQRHGDVE